MISPLEDCFPITILSLEKTKPVSQCSKFPNLLGRMAISPAFSFTFLITGGSTS